ncbi:MAG: LysM peptidoglycan-binding domain-containing protein [Chloroflexi bacterium]|nr:LysM peptidoglycan-binding domain-containing protein [Chloroflexota bacterium]
MEDAPRRRATIPWADLILFAIIGALLAFWWFRSPNVSSPQAVALSGTRTSTSGVTPPLLTATPALEPTPTLRPPTASTGGVIPPLPTDTPSPTATPVPTPIRYKVEPGDTLDLIAGRFGSTTQDIIDVNDLTSDGFIRVGDELLVPVKGPSGGPGPTPTPDGGTLVYAVQPGDTVESIATRFGSQVDWVLQANKLQADDLLRIGQSLLVPKTASTPAPATPTPTRPLPTLVPVSGYRAPALLTPGDGSLQTSGDDLLLSWTSVGILAKDEWYVVTLTVPGNANPLAPYWTKATTWRLPRDYRPAVESAAELTWRVQVISGTPGKPGTPASPASTPRTFTWR